MLKKSLLIIFVILFIDQAVKFWVKTHMSLGEEYHVLGNWFIIHFTENYGMAFGMEFAGGYGKLFLSIFRIIAVSAIGWYLVSLTKKGDASLGYIACISLIFAGAVGNIIDSAFYGMLFSDSMFQLSQFLPEDGGYAGFLHGKVVDMFYFPIIEGHFPQWLPFWGGEEFLFFSPVFNIADASITTGVLSLVLFQKNFFRKPHEAESSSQSSVDNPR